MKVIKISPRRIKTFMKDKSIFYLTYIKGIRLNKRNPYFYYGNEVERYLTCKLRNEPYIPQKVDKFLLKTLSELEKNKIPQLLKKTSCQMHLNRQVLDDTILTGKVDFIDHENKIIYELKWTSKPEETYLNNYFNEMQVSFYKLILEPDNYLPIIIYSTPEIVVLKNINKDYSKYRQDITKKVFEIREFVRNSKTFKPVLNWESEELKYLDEDSKQLLRSLVLSS